MGIENKLRVLMKPEDALSLCDGFFEDKTISYEILSEQNVLDAAYTLIEIGHENERPYVSRCDVLETALRMGWFPPDRAQAAIASIRPSKSSRHWIEPSSWVMFGFVLFILATATTVNSARLLFAFSSGASIALGVFQLSRGPLEGCDRND